MFSINRIATVTVTATLAGAALATPASAMHIVSETTGAVEQDVEAASQGAQNQVESARGTAEQAGSSTRRHARRTADERIHATSRTARETRSTVESRAAGVRRSVQRHAEDAAAEAERRATTTRSWAQRQADAAVWSARSSASAARSEAERHVEENRATAAQLIGEVQQRIELLSRELSRALLAILDEGSVTVNAGGENYSAGWTHSGGCWNGRMTTPLNPPTSRFRRHTGATVQPTKGGRTSAETSRGNASASSGC